MSEKTKIYSFSMPVGARVCLEGSAAILKHAGGGKFTMEEPTGILQGTVIGGSAADLQWPADGIKLDVEAAELQPNGDGFRRVAMLGP